MFVTVIHHSYRTRLYGPGSSFSIVVSSTASERRRSRETLTGGLALQLRKTYTSARVEVQGPWR